MKLSQLILVAEAAIVPDLISTGRNACEHKRAQIDALIDRFGVAHAPWSRETSAMDYAIYQKRGCAHGLTYDIEFCTLVCELPEYASCRENPTSGVDLCAAGLVCDDGKCRASNDVDLFSEDYFGDLYDYSDSSSSSTDLTDELTQVLSRIARGHSQSRRKS